MGDKNRPEQRIAGVRRWILPLGLVFGLAWAGAALSETAAQSHPPVAPATAPHLLPDALPADAVVETPKSMPTLRIGVEDGWPPYAGPQGRGLSTDIVKAAFAAVGVKITLEARPYARVLRDLESGLLDAGYNVPPQISTSERFIFGTEPLLTATVSFYYAPGAERQYASADVIPTGTTVATIIDYQYGDLFESQRSRFREYKVMRQSQIIRMLLAGRVEVGVLYDLVAAYTLSNMGLPADAVARGSVQHAANAYVAFSRQNPRSAEYAALLDEGLRIIRSNGVYEQILSESWQIPKPMTAPEVQSR